MHSTGAVAVFIFGIIYLRSRRIDFMISITHPETLSENSEEKSPVKVNPTRNSQPQAHFLQINEEFGDESSMEQDNDQQYLIWKIYDKIVDAFTSEFVVLNICRLGLIFWVLRYN